MEKPKKEITEDDVLAAILKVKPTEDMPRRRPKPKPSESEAKPSK
ncbi:MAG: hypothetical protein WBW55_10060 [Desulfobaccales bacterium]